MAHQLPAPIPEGDYHRRIQRMRLRAGEALFLERLKDDPYLSPVLTNKRWMAMARKTYRLVAENHDEYYLAMRDGLCREMVEQGLASNAEKASLTIMLLAEQAMMARDAAEQLPPAYKEPEINRRKMPRPRSLRRRQSAEIVDHLAWVAADDDSSWVWRLSSGLHEALAARHSLISDMGSRGVAMAVELSNGTFPAYRMLKVAYGHMQRRYADIVMPTHMYEIKGRDKDVEAIFNDPSYRSKRELAIVSVLVGYAKKAMAAAAETAYADCLFEKDAPLPRDVTPRLDGAFAEHFKPAYERLLEMARQELTRDDSMAAFRKEMTHLQNVTVDELFQYHARQKEQGLVR